jgi:NAD(P)H-binding
VRASGLKWTLVRVPFLTNGPRTERINVRMKGEQGGMRVSRANVAAFFLDQAHDTAWIGKAPYITDT